MANSTNLRSLFDSLKSHLSQLNLFNTGIPNEVVIRNERRSTRLYLILLIISMLIVGIYYFIISYTETIVIESLKFNQYSDLIKERSLECSCKNIAIKYEQFIELKPDYHELCESNLLSNEWINHLYKLYEQSWNKSIPTDFRRIGVFQFQTIRSLCKLVKDIINDGLQSFNHTDFIQSKLITEERFQIQINSFIKDFIEITSKTFLRTLQFLQDTTAQSLFMTGASMTSVRPITQYRFFIDYGIVPFPGMKYTFKDNFTCICSASTATSCMGLATFENNTVPGFQTGCYMLSALMNSTLEAFYNQTFINILSNSSKHFYKLNSSNSNLTVETLLSQMFVKSWSNSTSYKKYFQNCAPDRCQYTINQHYSFGAVILLLISYFGGLSSALKFIVPIVIMNIWPFIWKRIFRRYGYPVQRFTVEQISVMSMNTRIKMLFQLIKRKLIEFNLFKSIPPSQDEIILQQERQQTRIYLLLFLTGFIILMVFTSMRPYTVTVTVNSPSLKKYLELYDKNPSKLDCPCSKTTLEYHEIISNLKVKIHQICSSDFIKSRWINLKFIKSPVRVFFTYDIRYQSEIHFQLLSTLCHMANRTIEENIQLFYQKQFFTDQVLHPSSFQTQMNFIFDQFNRTLPESYQRTLQLIQTNSEINQFIVPFNFAFFYVFYSNGQSEFRVKSILNNEMLGYSCPPKIDICNCIHVSPSDCVIPTLIHHPEKIIEIPGMIQTVFPLRSILISTLECFYNETCLSEITRLIDPMKSSKNFSILQLSLNEKQNDTIDKLANKLFIQSWNYSSSYQLYFNQCQPTICKYTYKSQFNIIYIVTTIIGLLGGLSTSLQLFVRSLVKLIHRIWKNIICQKRNNILPAVETSVRSSSDHRFRVLIESMKKKIIELNLFPTISPSQDKKILHRSQRITRIYLFLLINSIFILAIYTYLTQEPITKIETFPSIFKYKELIQQHPRTLQCSCNHITVKYEKFLIEFKPEYHPICSSIFVSSKWYDSVYDSSRQNDEHFVDDDFRLCIKEQFETVSKLCSLSKNILNTSLSVWLQSDFITTYLLPLPEFNFQIDELIEEFKRKTISMFIQTLKLIQTVNHANQLATRRLSNWQFIHNPINPINSSILESQMHELDPNIAETILHVLTLPKVYDEDNCSCALQSNCSKLSNFPFPISNQSLRKTLPGFRIGCYFLDSLFQSTFSCLYNQTCLALMTTAIYYSKHIRTEILQQDRSLLSSNKTIETYLNQLFVIKWFKNVSYDHYFNQCSPQSCEYSYTSKFNQVYFLTTIIALFGGLTEGLHFAVYCISLIIFKLYDYRKKKQVIPCSQQPNVTVDDLDNQTLEIATITTINAINRNPIENQTNSSISHKDRTIIICLFLLFIVTIIIVSVFWLRNQISTYFSMTTSITTMIMSITTTESTTISTDTCYMTFLTKPVNYPIGLGSKSFLIADLNNDSILDLAVTNYHDHTISILIGIKNGTFQIEQIYSTGNETYPWGITIGDFNNDTFSDLAVALSATNQIAFFFGIGSNGSFETVLYTIPDPLQSYTMPIIIEANDLNGDGFIDLLIGYAFIEWKSQSVLKAMLNVGNGRQYNYTILNDLHSWYIDSIAIGDFNNDGRENDISVCNLDGKVITLFYINYTELYESGMAVKNFMYGKPQSIIRGRFNNDQFDDLAVISSESDTLQVLLAMGNGEFTQQIYSTDSYPTSIARINFNNDSIDDLVVLTCNQTMSIYLGTNLGIFHQNPISFHLDENNNIECVHSLRVADLNQDGKDDLIFINPTIQSVSIVLSMSCNENI